MERSRCPHFDEEREKRRRSRNEMAPVPLKETGAARLVLEPHRSLAQTPLSLDEEKARRADQRCFERKKPLFERQMTLLSSRMTNHRHQVTLSLEQ
jgi:hypothetical protein